MSTPRTALTSWASRAATLAVAAVAGYASYRHIAHVATMAGETIEVATVLPLAIDGLIVVGTMAMLADKAAGRAPRASARVALGFGVVATLAANIASAQPTLLGRAVAAVPAAAFLLAVEVLARRGKLLPTEETATLEMPPMTAVEAVDSTLPEPPAADRSTPAPQRIKSSPIPAIADRVVAIATRHPELSASQVAARLGIADRTARRYMPRPDPALVSAPERTPDRPVTAIDLVDAWAA